MIKQLTAKEEEVMQHFWNNKQLFVKELVELYPHPTPHFNTLSTYVRLLEDKGFLSHKTYGNSYQYFAVISEDEYKSRNLKQVIKKYFDNSYLSAVSAFIKEKNLSVDEIRQLLDEVEKKSEK